MKPHKSLIELFLLAMLQVSLVCLSTYMIVHEQYAGTFIVSFAISYVWTGNIKKVAIGGLRERIAYASGAAFGGLTGLLIGKFILISL